MIDLSNYFDNLNYGNIAKASYMSDFSVAYLYDDKAAEKIYKEFPYAKIVIILRNPVIREFSHYKHLRRDMRETLSFREALDVEIERISKGFEFIWHYRAMGMYYLQVKRYLDLFGSDNVKIFIYEEIFNDEVLFFAELADFLGCKYLAKLQFDESKFNQTGIPKSNMFASIFNKPTLFRHLAKSILPRRLGGIVAKKLRAVNFSEVKLELSHDDYTYLFSSYYEDIASLCRLIKKDLCLWSRIP